MRGQVIWIILIWGALFCMLLSMNFNTGYSNFQSAQIPSIFLSLLVSLLLSLGLLIIPGLVSKHRLFPQDKLKRLAAAFIPLYFSLLYPFHISVPGVGKFNHYLVTLIIFAIGMLWFIQKDHIAKDKIIRIVLWLVIAISLHVRLFHINNPLTEAHQFRQTQTAITVKYYLKEGYSILAYQTPVLGPPWQVPYEFPLFQTAAFGLVKLGVINVDVACRLTNIIFFYLSAVVLYFLCLQFFNRKATAVILAYYLFAPYMIYWSRTSMIDYLSVFLALGYFLFFIKWLKEQQQLKYMLTATCLGVLGFMVKGTSMLPVIIPLAYFILKFLITDYRKSEGSLGLTPALNYFSFNWKYILSIGVLALLPFIAGKLWIMHTDSVKALSDTTDLFAVANSDHWNYGSWEQRLDIQNWKRIWKRIPNSFLPQLTIIFPFIALIPFKENRDKLEILYLCVAGILVTVITFFNLYYVHNYYLMGISPYLAIMVGIGIYFTFQKLNTYKYTRPLILVLLMYMMVVYYNQLPYLKQTLRNNKASRLTAMGNYLNRITSDNEYIVVTDHGWSPHILYYAERKGLMIKKPEWMKHSMIKENNFTVVVGKRKYAKLMANWNYHKLIKQVGQIKIFKVSNDSTDLQSYPEVKSSPRKKKKQKKPNNKKDLG